MSKQIQYKTKQKERILTYLSTLGDTHFTATDLQLHFISTEKPIGLSTIYRCLEGLVEQGIVRKYLLDQESGACFQYTGESPQCEEHFHLKCERCGNLIHLECSVLKDVSPHILKQHSFHLNTAKTVFYGTCERCYTQK